MSQSIELNSFTRLALVIIAVALVVAVIHIVSGSARFEKRAGALTAVCAVILCAGFAALAMLSRGRPDAIELEGFERFASDDTAAAAELTEKALESIYIDAGDAMGAELTRFELNCADGEFTRLSLTAAFTEDEGESPRYWLRTVIVDADGSCRAGSRVDVEDEPETVGAAALIDAVAGLDAGWLDTEEYTTIALDGGALSVSAGGFSAKLML